MHPLNVIRGWSLPPDIIVRNCWFNQQVNLLKLQWCHIYQSQWQWHHGVLSFTILSVFELVNQVDRGLKWLTIQEDIQSYKSFQPCHSLVCEIHKAHPSRSFYQLATQKRQPAYLKIDLRTPHLFVGQLVPFFSKLITSVIITSYKLLLCDSTLVHFGSCLV